MIVRVWNQQEEINKAVKGWASHYNHYYAGRTPPLYQQTHLAALGPNPTADEFNRAMIEEEDRRQSAPFKFEPPPCDECFRPSVLYVEMGQAPEEEAPPKFCLACMRAAVALLEATS